ncbi:DoxX family protein [Streptomonospora nanhaiensis]|uniref:Putative membrane protein n=1 Tax=Streptomonospora nanhaiensis TaxID=1323731 RepID=A0A853BRT4_9ACTN|nr:DoxX family protein [Streptomonospora nanhaiensis]MBV2364062.1 DoxX family protein [Streptomonospora nanhaiensis]MBX9388654.1 DoxX family protein [Streptomonospora nanhaiensis]NYI97062.1 putative membrane protein [Streptomonospora nanhaiensis]
MNVTLIALGASTAAFRGLGALGVRRFATWRDSAAHGMAAMLLLTASAHFVPPSVTVMPTHADMVAMVPPQLPYPELLVYATGVLELAGAAGLVWPRTRRSAAACLALLFVLMFPANAYAALNEVPLAGDPATPLVPRLLEQLLYIGLMGWVAWPRGLAAKPAPKAAAAERA